MANKPRAPTPPLGDLGLSPEVQRVLERTLAELTFAYRESFIAMMGALQQQASALERIQNTLNILIKQIAPQLAGTLPTAVKIARDGEPDLASAIVVADPIATGYTMSQSALAKALGLSTADVSALVRGFKLADDGRCTVVVRKGSQHNIVNYHPRAVDRFRRLVDAPPSTLNRNEQSALLRVRAKLRGP